MAPAAPVKAWVDAMNSGNVDAALAPFTDDVFYNFVFTVGGKEQVRGVFDWLVGIRVKTDSLYQLRQQSFPPPRFSVSQYRSRYASPLGLDSGTVYSTMARTAFEDFSKNIVRHFGIGASGARSSAISTLGNYRSRH